MTRSRKTEYNFANSMRTPIESLFSLLPNFILQYLLRWFRWSESMIGYGIRYMCVKKLSKSCGSKVLIFPGCKLHWIENMELGENISIHDFCYLDAVGGLKIGNNVRIAHNCSFITGQHRYDVADKTIYESGYKFDKIILGDDVWLGTGAVILPGLEIGDGVVIGANSVVTKNIAPYSVVGGVPAKLIVKRPNFDGK